MTDRQEHVAATEREAALVTEQDVRMLRTAIDDLTELTVLYERRLIFKGRYRAKAMLAAASRRHALSILKEANRVWCRAGGSNRDA